MEKIHEENLDRMQEYEESILSTKELKDFGLSPYQIKLYLESGYFEKVSFGKYKITIISKRKSLNEDYIRGLFKDLKISIEYGYYEKANIILLHICEDKTTHTFDGDIYVILAILKNILGKNRDYSYANNLKFKKSSLNNGDLAIYNSNYFNAKKNYFSLYAMESNTDLGVSDLTFIKYVLLNEAMRRADLGICPDLRNSLARDFYSSFIECVRARKHRMALQELDKCINYTDDPNIKETYLMIREVTRVIVDYVSTRKCGLNRIDYGYENNPVKLLKKSIYKHDFIYAYYIMNEYDLGEIKSYKCLKNMLRDSLKICGKYQEYLDFWNDTHKNVEDAKVATVDTEEIETKTEEKIETPLKENTVNDYYFKKRYENKYAVLLNYIESAYYGEALSYLKEVVTEDIKTDDYKIYKLLCFLKHMEDNKVGFSEYNNDYDGLSLEKLFEKAILDDDYYIAFRNIGKLTYNNPNEALALMKTILHKMYEINKKYGVAKRVVVKKEEKKEEISEVGKNLSLEKMEEVEPEEKGKNLEDNEEIDKSDASKVLDTKEEKVIEIDEEYIPYNYGELYNALNEGKFASVFERLKVGYRTGELNRMEVNTYRLLMVLNHYKLGTLDENDSEVEESYNIFANFYQALKYHKVEDIIKYYKIAYDGARDKSEFEIYGFVVREIERLYEGKKIIEPINQVIKSILDGKNTLTSGEISELFKLLDTKCEFDALPGYIEYVILEMIDMLVKDDSIDATYFMNYLDDKLMDNDEYSVELPDLDNQNVDKMIDTLLLKGDFINAYKLIYETPFGACLKKYTTNDRIIIRLLLQIFNNLVSREKVAKEKVDKEKELRLIKQSIKKYDFIGALKAVYAATHVDEDLLAFILEGILQMHVGGYILEKYSRDDFTNAIKKRDLESARKAILDYENMINHFLYTEKYQDELLKMQNIYEKRKEMQGTKKRKRHKK